MNTNFDLAKRFAIFMDNYESAVQILFEHGKIKNIVHVDLPDEVEKLQRWRDEMGIKR